LFPSDIAIIDTFIGFTHATIDEVKASYKAISDAVNDKETKEDMIFPAEYMFKNSPEISYVGSNDPLAVTISEMDAWNVERAMISVSAAGDTGDQALKRYPDRFIPSTSCNPNGGMSAVADIVKIYETWGVRAVGGGGSFQMPPVPINDKKMYPIYGKCIEGIRDAARGRVYAGRGQDHLRRLLPLRTDP